MQGGGEGKKKRGIAGVGWCWGPLEEQCACLAPLCSKARVLALACNLLRLTRPCKCLADAGVPLGYLCGLQRRKGVEEQAGCLNKGFVLYIISDKWMHILQGTLICKNFLT